MARTAVSDHPADRGSRRHPDPAIGTAPAAIPRVAGVRPGDIRAARPTAGEPR